MNYKKQINEIKRIAQNEPNKDKAKQLIIAYLQKHKNQESAKWIESLS